MPKTLKKIGHSAFHECERLRTIYAQDECEVSFYRTGVPRLTNIGPPPETLAGGVQVWELRQLAEVTIPEGITRVGKYWFYGSRVESVTFPASVRELGSSAFQMCKSLRKLKFAKNSQL